MKNIFILHLPMNDPEEIIHYNETVINKVDQNIIFPFIDDEFKEDIILEFEDYPIAVWRLLDNSVNRSKFEKIKPGDEILIVEGDIIKSLSKIFAKTINIDLANALWKNYENRSNEKWSLIFMMSGSISINLAFSELLELFGYSDNWKPDGLIVISEEKLKEFYSKYDNLYKVLKNIKDRE